MKRLLGLLLVMGMVGCGQNENAGNAVDPSIGADEQLVTDSDGEKSDPSNPNVKVDEPPVQTIDASPAGEAALPSPPEKPQANVDEPPVQAVDGSKWVQRDGLMYEGDSETPFTGVAVYKHENGQKKLEYNYKDGKPEGLMTAWYENGKKKVEGTFKDGKPEGPGTMWHANGQKKAEATFKDGKLVSETKWDEEGNEIKK